MVRISNFKSVSLEKTRCQIKHIYEISLSHWSSDCKFHTNQAEIPTRSPSLCLPVATTSPFADEEVLIFME